MEIQDYAALGGIATMNGDMLGGLGGGYVNFDEFMKAVTSNAGLASGGSDIALLTGGAALREQSLEGTLRALIPKKRQFKFFNKLARAKATAVLHEYSRQTDTGWYEGQAFNGEMEDIGESQGTYERKFNVMRWLHTMFQVSIAQKAQKTIVDTITREKMNATLRILTDTEWGLFYGDSSVNAREFDGVIKQIRDHNDSDLIVNARGRGLSTMGEEVVNIATAIRTQGHFGRATDLYCSPNVGTAEFNQKLNQSMRIGLDGTTGGLSTAVHHLTMGAMVGAINAGDDDIIAVNNDIFLTESQPPWEGRPGNYPSLATNCALGLPQSVGDGSGGAATVAHTVADSLFEADDEGGYYYGVESTGKGGRTAVVKSAQVSVVAGDSVTVGIQNPVDTNVTGFVVHRSRKDGTNASSDMREMARIPRAAGAITTYVDKNQNIPGTSPVIVLNQSPESDAIALVRLYELFLLPLFRTRTASDLAAVVFSAVLQMGLPEQHGIILNVLPGNARWNPRG